MNECPFCSGPLIPLGSLGKLLWCRCRNCGSEVGTAQPVEEEEKD
jgi:hypothetical protein